MPYGALTVLGSHSCVALSPVKATELYHTMPEAQSVKLKGFVITSFKKSPTILHESQLIKIGAKIVKHPRYVTFQKAEVLLSKRLFQEILERIHRLKPGPIGYD